MKRGLPASDSFLVINTTGIGGIANNQLRGELKKKGIKLMVVKNTLAKKALDKDGYGGGRSAFERAMHFAFGGDSVIDVAKEFAELVKKLQDDRGERRVS